MNIRCDQCGEALLPLASFCSYCGSEAPRLTMPAMLEKKLPENPIYCPACGEAAPNENLYCAECGHPLYKFPSQEPFFCPNCQAKNRMEARICASCGLSLIEWFSMRGIVARRLGYQRDLLLHETMTDTFYHFIWKTSLFIGRLPTNDITLLCPWVSGRHCFINLESHELIDLDSKNGTYINRSKQRIKSVSFEQIYEFNVGGSFTFTVVKLTHAFIFRLTAILDAKEYFGVSHVSSFEELRKHYFILLRGDSELFIRKMDGVIEKADKILPDESYFFKIEDQYYYFSDFSRGIENRLILRKHQYLPVNWEIKIQKDTQE